MSNLPAVPHQTPAPAVPAVGTGLSIAELTAVAKQVAASRLFPGVENEQAAFTLMLLCQAEGLHPINAMRRYHIIKGRPSMRADAMQAEFQRQGGVVAWLESSNDVCSARFTHPAHAPEGFVVTVRLAELHAAGVTQSNPNYARWPRQMLRARAISEGVRAVLPGVVVGIYSDVEVEDMAMERAQLQSRPETPQAAIDVTPPSGPPLAEVLKDARIWANDELLRAASTYGQTVEDEQLLLDADLETWTYGECVRRGLIPATTNGKGPNPATRSRQLENALVSQPAVVRSVVTGLAKGFLAEAREKLRAQAGVGEAFEEALSN